MSVISKSTYVFAFIDAFITAFVAYLSFAVISPSVRSLLAIMFIFAAVVLIILNSKGFYQPRQYGFKDIYRLFEGIFIACFLAGVLVIPIIKGFAAVLILYDIALIFIVSLVSRAVYALYKKFFKPVKNILIVGAGENGKFIAEEIQSRPELGMKVVGFLDDNMNTIAEEDSSIPILGLTYDSEAVIKDNNVDMVIIAVKSRMDADILTDLAHGIPLGVKVWRMPTFYAHITRKLFVSKMSVNWLFYDYVRPKHIMYSHVKRILDKFAALAILLVTLPITLIAMLGIKLSDFGPIFYTQTRIGKFGRPFKMLKFRTMYQDKVDKGFDDDLIEIAHDDKRIMPFCKWIRKFHIDDIPQMLNILKGEMSIVGPRPVREDVYDENRENIRYWECRNWVRPGWTGWQQVNVNEPIPEERLRYDLYYVKNRTLVWDIAIFFQYLAKLLSGKCK